MSEPSITCITCGHQVQDPPVLNVDSRGRNCRTCADRVLESQPELLPTDLAPRATPRLVLVRDEDPEGSQGGDDWRPEPA